MLPLRVSSVQFHHHSIKSFDEFVAQVRRDVLLAKDFGSRLVCFPEYVTGSLLTIPGQEDEGLTAWDRWTGPYLELFSDLARQCGLYILGGTHLVREGDRWYNTAHLFTPSGGVYTQRKLHLTPVETDPWRLGTGERVRVFETDLGRLAILICYDIEFPEAARAAADAGADLLLCPSATDDRAGFWRVRYCCLARAVENQVYVVHSALVGGLPGVRYLEQSYGRSGILSPCDIPFARDGVVADGEWNQELVVTGLVHTELLAEVRAAGSVTPRQSRRAAYHAEIVTAP
ncbi:MAG: carbon-nitrogen hydrolase family protein [Firmicutes bacterium]|nr:carbon-nitrogen hydrolase family protein [Bacillota bacterium]